MRTTVFTLAFLGMLFLGWDAVMCGFFITGDSWHADPSEIVEGMQARIFGAMVAIPSAMLVSHFIRAEMLPPSIGRMACGVLLVNLGREIQMTEDLNPIFMHSLGLIPLMGGLWMIFSGLRQMSASRNQGPLKRIC
jgi:hypothetical protein